MFKQILVALPFSFFILCAASLSWSQLARAGDDSNLSLVNGPPGPDLNMLLDRKARNQTYRKKNCDSLRRKYIRTKRRSWLNKYRNCRAQGY